MNVDTEIETVPFATWTCALHKNHGTANPIRGIVHYIQPLGAGGLDTFENKIIICANGHDAIHAVMWAMLTNKPVPPCSRKESEIAQLGVARWKLAGEPGDVLAFRG